LRLIGSSDCGRDAGHLAPSSEEGVAGGTMLVDGQAVAVELEVVVDAAVGRECRSAWKFGSSAASVQVVAAAGVQGYIA